MIRKAANLAAHVCSTIGIWISAGLLVYMVVHVNLEIILRSFFATSTNAMSEYVGYALGAMTYLSLAHTLRSRPLWCSALQPNTSGRSSIATSCAGRSARR